MPLPTYVAPGGSYDIPAEVAPPVDPSASNLYHQLVGNLSGALRGELPEDVKQLLQQKAAQNAVASGTSGSQFADYQGLRTLGLTSLDRMQGAENSLVSRFFRQSQAAHQARPTPLVPGYQGGGGGFESTTPHYNVAPIRSGGGTQTLPDYTGGQRAAPTRATDPNAMYQQIIDKYSGIGNSGSAPMGQYGGSPLNNIGGGGPGYGYGNDQDVAGTTPVANRGSFFAGTPQDYGNNQLNAATYEQMQQLTDMGLNPMDFGYSNNADLSYASPQVLADRAIYE